MRLYLWFTLLCLAGQVALPAMAQPPVIQWQRTIGGSGNDRLQSIHQTPDGGYIVAGYSTSGISGEKAEASFGLEDYWVLKLDAAGNIQWQKTIGGAHNDILTTILPTADGGYLCSGWSTSGVAGSKTAVNRGGAGMVGNFSLGRDFWLVKLSSTGAIQWQETYGGTSYDMGFQVLQHADGGYVVTGLSYVGGGTGNNTMTNYGQNDYWMLKLDATGNIQWQRSHGGTQHDGAYGMSRASGGGYIMGGEALSGANGSKTTPFYGGGADNWVVKTDASGNAVWQVQLGGSGQDIQVGGSLMSPDNGVIWTADSGYLVGMTSNSPVSGTKTIASRGGFDYWVVKLDGAGAIQWQEVVGGTGDEYLGSILVTADGGYMYAGHSNSGANGDKTVPNIGDKDWWLVKKDAARVVEWQLALGGTGTEELMTIQQTTDGGYIVGGYSNSGISGNKTEANRGDYDYWIVKLGPCDTTPTRVTRNICIGDSYTLPGGTTVSTPGVYHDTLTNTWGTCDSIVITTINYYSDNVHLLNGNALGKDTSFCAGDAYRLSVSFLGASYSWNTGATTPFLDVSATGDYIVTITSQNGCVARDTVTITVHEYPVVDLGPDRGICDRDTPMVLTSPQPSGYHYLWSNGLSDTQLTVTRTGTYWLQVDNQGCKASDTLRIKVVPEPEVYAGSDSIICEQFPARIGTEVPGASYLWSTGATTPYIQVAATGNYVLEVDIEGCLVYDTVNITALPVPDIDLGLDGDICPEQIIQLDATYETNSSYRWNTGETTAAISVSAAGSYWVEVLTENGCVGRDTVTLTHFPRPIVDLGADTTVCEETPLVLKPHTLHADSLLWSDGSVGAALSVIHGGQYIAIGVNKCGTGADTIDVRQIFCDIWVPNAFTPNGDGQNDQLRVLGNIGRLEGFGLSVYNRWGERIFYTRDKYTGWDGTWNGLPAQLGTYVYMLEYNIGNTPYLQKGNVVLLR
jgi:gliding motility-associated-like protein